LWGVGAKRSQLYRRHGLETVADFLLADAERIARLFGVDGCRLQAELRGEHAYPLSSRRLLQKSIMSTRSFKSTVSAETTILDAVSFHVREAQSDLRSMGVSARKIAVLARAGRHSEYAGYGFYREAVFESPTDDIFTLLNTATALVKAGFSFGVPYKKAGVILSDFVPNSVSQGVLFSQMNPDRKAVLQTLDALRKKHGHAVIQVGTYLQGERWQASRASLSPAYTTKWSELATVV
jgi:DNA polymerase V